MERTVLLRESFDDRTSLYAADDFDAVALVDAVAVVWRDDAWSSCFKYCGVRRAPPECVVDELEAVLVLAIDREDPETLPPQVLAWFETEPG